MKSFPKFTILKPFTKTIILLIFITLSFFGFYLVYKYKTGSLSGTKTFNPEKKISIGDQAPSKDQTNVCGAIPDTLKITRDHFTMVTGPTWSPDCCHIAYASWQSTLANPSIPVGLFVYDLSSKKTQKIYSPKQGQDEEDIEFQNWKTNNSIIFTKDGQRHLYTVDINTKIVTE